MSVEAWIVMFHVLSAVLPSIGIGHAVYRKRRPVAKVKRYKRLEAQFKQDRAEAENRGDTDAVKRLTKEFEERVNIRDRFQMGLVHYAMITTNAQSVLDRQAYLDLLRDAIWVVAGIAIGTVANIWSMFI